MNSAELGFIDHGYNEYTVITRLRIVMHLKSVKYACKYALKAAKICTENTRICTEKLQNIYNKPQNC
jgi:hypothetical protein